MFSERWDKFEKSLNLLQINIFYTINVITTYLHTILYDTNQYDQ